MWSTHELGAVFGEYAEFDLRQLTEMYEVTVDHGSYPTFEGWLWDMERSATLTRH